MQTFKQFITEDLAGYRARTIRNNIITIDGIKTYQGTAKLWGCNLTKLPDLSDIRVTGDFECFTNDLTTLEGSPQSIGGNYNAYNNPLKSLKGVSEFIGGTFYSDQFSDADYRKYIEAQKLKQDLDPESNDLFGGMIDTI